MNQKLLLYAFTCLLATNVLCLRAENVVVQKLDHSETMQALETIGRFEFNHTDRLMLLILKDGTTAETYSLDEVHKIYFSGEEGLQNTADGMSVIVDGDRLIVEGANESTVLRIFSMNGQLMTQQTGNAIHIGTLTTGVYLLQCNQGIVRFIKN